MNLAKQIFIGMIIRNNPWSTFIQGCFGPFFNWTTEWAHDVILPGQSRSHIGGTLTCCSVFHQNYVTSDVLGMGDSVEEVHCSLRFHPHTPCRSHCTHSLSWCENHQLHSHTAHSLSSGNQTGLCYFILFFVMTFLPSMQSLWCTMQHEIHYKSNRTMMNCNKCKFLVLNEKHLKIHTERHHNEMTVVISVISRPDWGQN